MSVTYTPALAKSYEGIDKASPFEERCSAINRLHFGGFEVWLRLSPYLSDFIMPSELDCIKTDKICIEFLRVSSAIRKNCTFDTSEYTEKSGNYWHLPLRYKIDLVKALPNIYRKIAICEDHPDHYEYWLNQIWTHKGSDGRCNCIEYEESPC